MRVIHDFLLSRKSRCRVVTYILVGGNLIQVARSFRRLSLKTFRIPFSIKALLVLISQKINKHSNQIVTTKLHDILSLGVSRIMNYDFSRNKLSANSGAL